VKRAAERYLDPEERTVGLYHREAEGGER
jgi:hypothetical protein